MAKALGARKIALPTAGNAGGAAAAYAAKAGLECHVFMPKDTPKVFRIECEAYGAKVGLVDGLIDDCGKIVAERKDAEGWFDVSTLKEPYRVEGKKTMGYEIAEQLGWTLPDVVVYPTGGGTGLIGMWKAFDEMEKLGWIGSARPRMVSVQAEGCAPIPKAFAEGRDVSVRFENAHTYASGLSVPKAYADYLILKILRESNGEAVVVTDDEMRRGVVELASHEGLFAAPEGGAAWEAVKQLVAAGKVGQERPRRRLRHGDRLQVRRVGAASAQAELRLRADERRASICSWRTAPWNPPAPFAALEASDSEVRISETASRASARAARSDVARAPGARGLGARDRLRRAVLGVVPRRGVDGHRREEAASSPRGDGSRSRPPGGSRGRRRRPGPSRTS